MRRLRWIICTHMSGKVRARPPMPAPWMKTTTTRMAMPSTTWNRSNEVATTSTGETGRGWDHAASSALRVKSWLSLVIMRWTTKAELATDGREPAEKGADAVRREREVRKSVGFLMKFPRPGKPEEIHAHCQYGFASWRRMRRRVLRGHSRLSCEVIMYPRAAYGMTGFDRIVDWQLSWSARRHCGSRPQRCRRKAFQDRRWRLSIIICMQRSGRGAKRL